MIPTFNSLYEIPTMCAAKPTARFIVKSFQFSLWDSKKGKGLRQQLEEENLSILSMRFGVTSCEALALSQSTFNSLYEIQNFRAWEINWRSKETFNSLYEIRLNNIQDMQSWNGVAFQFSLWDSASAGGLGMLRTSMPFNSLYEIQLEGAMRLHRQV